MTLKEVRKLRNISQKEAAKQLGVSLRSYVSYENDENKADTIKYQYMVDMLEKMSHIDEEHGIISVDVIRDTCKDIFESYGVEYAYLFGSYAKGLEKESSDVDILISASVSGLKFYGLVEEIREKLCKKIDLLDIRQLQDNPELLDNVLRDGIKIYG